MCITIQQCNDVEWLETALDNSRTQLGYAICDEQADEILVTISAIVSRLHELAPIPFDHASDAIPLTVDDRIDVPR